MIVADRPSFEQRFPCCERGLAGPPLFFQQSEQTAKDRSDKTGTRRL